MTIRSELAIIGGGPAGLAAAIEAARRGVSVTLVDAGEEPGGALALQTHAYPGIGLRGFAIGTLFWQAAEAAGATLMPRTLAWGVFEDRTVGLALDHGTDREWSELLQADMVLIATGAIDCPPVFPGATLPGVITATAALTIWHRWRVLPGTTALVVGDDPITPLIAQYGSDAGMKIVVTPTSDGLSATAGPDGTLAQVERHDANGAVVERFAVDTLILAAKMQPANELARMVECATAWCAPLGGYVPLRAAGLQTTVSGLSIAGDAAGVGDTGSAILQGRIAAAAIADALGKKRQPFGVLPVTVVPGAFRPLDATIGRSVRLTEAIR